MKHRLSRIFLLIFLLGFCIPGYTQKKETQGDYSPIVETIYGDIKLTFPKIPDQALRAIIQTAVNKGQQPLVNEVLELNQEIRLQNSTLRENTSAIQELEATIKQQAQAFLDLKKELETRETNDDITQRANKLLDQGLIDEAEQVLEQDAYRLNRKAAHRNYEVAKAKELNLKYHEANEWFEVAATLSPNFNYLNAYGRNLHTIGKYDLAIQYYQQALQLDRLNSPDSSVLFNNLGSSLILKGDFQKAIEYFQKAIDIDSLNAETNKADFGVKYSNLGVALMESGNPDLALPYFMKAIKFDTMVIPKNQLRIALNYNNIGVALEKKGDFDQAFIHFQNSLNINIRELGELHPRVATGYNNLGSILSKKGNHSRAIKFHLEALTIDTTLFNDDHTHVARDYNNLGNALVNNKEFDEGIGYLQKGLAINLKTLGSNHIWVAACHNNLGKAYYFKRNHQMSIFHYKKALRIVEITLGTAHPSYSITRKNLAFTENAFGMTFYQNQEYDSAINYFISALTNAKATEQSSLLLTCYNNVGGSLRHLSRHEEALQQLKKGQTLANKLDSITLQTFESWPDSLKQHPNYESYKKSKLNTFIIHRMKLHQMCSLEGLGHNKESKALREELEAYAIKNEDERMLADLEKGCK